MVIATQNYYLKKDYLVHGVKRRSSSVPTLRINKFLKNNNFRVHYGDLTDAQSVDNLIKLIKPDEIYNLAANPIHSILFCPRIYF